MKRSETIAKLAGALSKAQQAFTAAERDHTAKVQTRTGGEYSFAYADLAAYLDVCRGPLGDNGLSFIQEPIRRDNEVTVVTFLMHESGEWIESEPLVMNLIGQGQDQLITPQVIGSAITYARRYSLSALIGMASEADDDGNAASGNKADIGKKDKPQRPACPKCDKGNQFVNEDKQTAGKFYCWKKPELKKFGCGHQWTPAPEVDTAMRDEAYKVMMDASYKGQKAFDKAFKGLSQEQRMALQNDLDALKGCVLDEANQLVLKAWTQRIRSDDTNLKRLNELLVEARDLDPAKFGRPVKFAIFAEMKAFAEEHGRHYDSEKKLFADNPQE